LNKKITIAGANILFLVNICLSIVFQIFLSAIYSDNFIQKNMYQILLFNEFVVILIPSVLYVIIKGENLKDVFRIKRIRLIPACLIALISIPAYFVAMMLNSVMIFLLQYIGQIPAQSLPAPKNTTEMLIGILVISISPAICEEALHRGVLLKAYERRGTIKAILISAFFFGLFHLDITNLLGPIFLGILIGYYVIRTNSIFAGVLAHFLNNTIALFLQFLFTSTETNTRSEGFPLDSLLFTLFLGITGAVIAYKLLKIFKAKTVGCSTSFQRISNTEKESYSIMSHWPVVVSGLVYILVTWMYFLSIIFQ
jgi:uncharacterized protein